jgi:hypothetical protein
MSEYSQFEDKAFQEIRDASRRVASNTSNDQCCRKEIPYWKTPSVVRGRIALQTLVWLLRSQLPHGSAAADATGIPAEGCGAVEVSSLV